MKMSLNDKLFNEFEVKMPMKDIIRLKNVGDIVTRVIELVNAKA